MRDVAKEAGVSAMAVSYVLHGSGKNVRVSEQTAQRIREAAKRLSYMPNSFARNLRSGKTKTVGVVFQHFDRLSEANPYYPMFLNGVMSALFPADYTLALCPKLVQDGDIGAMLDGRFDGVLWARPDFTEANIETLRNARVPLVMLHAPPGIEYGMPTFCVDNEQGIKLAIDHLIALGHQNLAYLIDRLNYQTAEARYRVEAFIRLAKELSIEAEVVEWQGTETEVNELVARTKRPTGLICFSDTLAGNLLNVFAETGISIPEDFSVIGFDSSFFCERTNPPLTSINQPVEKIAHDATVHLLALIEQTTEERSESESSAHIYACSIDIRESTAARD